MNIDLIVEIVSLALSLINNALNGGQTATAVTSALVQILQKGAQAYEQHTGQPLDPGLIHVETPV